MTRHIFLFGISLLLMAVEVDAQQFASIKGTISNQEGIPLFPVSVSVKNRALGTHTDTKGLFNLRIPANDTLYIMFSYLGYKTIEDTLFALPDKTYEINKRLETDTRKIEDVVVFGTPERENTLIRLDYKAINQLPNASQNIESLLKTFSGVTSNSELTAQYSVRGGSFDENLIYVNDIEIYRPLLVRSAQQEGLSFVNPGMVSSIQFSAGGFDAEYGDKLSSVLDIKYKQPDEFGGSVIASLMGGAVNLEGASKNKKFTHITGFRYKTTKYLLSSLDTKGDYKPDFADLQSYLTYDISDKLEVSFLANYASNRFSRKPDNRSTDFGTFQESYNFTVFYEGQEIDRFDTYLGSLSLNYRPSNKLNLKFTGSAFYSDETVTYDILKEYWLNLAGQSSSGKRDSLLNIGIGSQLEHARNYLKYSIYSFSHKGNLFHNNGILKWGVKVKQEIIDDKTSEWVLRDSAGMSLPASNEEVNLDDVIKTDRLLDNYRLSGYLQHTFNLNTPGTNFALTLGVRAQYWTQNKDVTVSPRATLTIKNDNTPDISWHIAGGVYHQPPFYKEMIDQYGNFYPDQKAQRSLHLLVGNDYTFKAWGRPFIFTTEAYYKYLSNLVPYKLEDVRIQYLPGYTKTRGYALGIDFKVYGEFVPGTESWFSLSFLSTKEEIYNLKYRTPENIVEIPGPYPRPTDQWLNMSLFFQDYLPMNPNFKMHLMVSYGTGLYYAGPDYQRPSDVYRLSPYRRVDIGFSRLIVRKVKSRYGIETIWIGAEILNLLDAKNTVSYDWMRSVESNSGLGSYYSGNYFAVPNYLTRRSLNFKVSVNF